MTRKVKKFSAEKVSAGLVQIKVKVKTSAGMSEYSYKVYGSGDIVIEHTASLKGSLPPLPRVGIQLQIPGEYNNFTWYGRGPHESYPDRKLGAKIGVYSGTVEEQYVPYIMPQENGNKTDVRWISLSNDDGTGIMVSGMQALNVSAHFLTGQDLDIAKHTYEVYNREDITPNLDYRMSGLGNGSCGPGVLPEYQVQPGSFSYSVRLRPFTAGDMSPGRLSRLELP